MGKHESRVEEEKKYHEGKITSTSTRLKTTTSIFTPSPALLSLSSLPLSPIISRLSASLSIRSSRALPPPPPRLSLRSNKVSSRHRPRAPPPHLGDKFDALSLTDGVLWLASRRPFRMNSSRAASRLESSRSSCESRRGRGERGDSFRGAATSVDKRRQDELPCWTMLGRAPGGSVPKIAVLSRSGVDGGGGGREERVEGEG